MTHIILIVFDTFSQTRPLAMNIITIENVKLEVRNNSNRSWSSFIKISVGLN